MSANHKLLQDVRRVATEHEARCSAILNELQSLSARMGALPMSREPFTAWAMRYSWRVEVATGARLPPMSRCRLGVAA